MAESKSYLLLRIFIGENDRHLGKPLYETLLLEARRMGLHGGTVLRGIAGFGASSVLHTTRILRMSHDLPIVLEVVDSQDLMDPYIERVEEMLDAAGCGALITSEKVNVIRYRPSGDKGPRGSGERSD